MEGVESIIDLDVGGTRFRTSRQTLLSDPNCMLAKMFDPDSSFTAPGVKKDGAYFLDRDPVLFGAVLNYLRSGHLEKDCNVPALLKEASYFGLLGLEADLQQLVKEQANSKEQAKVRKGDQIHLNVGGEIFVTSKETLCWEEDPEYGQEKMAKRVKNGRLARLVKGEDKQEFDKDGNLFIDCDPKDFVYVLKALRMRGKGGQGPEIRVPKEVYSNVWGLAASLGLDGGYRESKRFKIVD